jgi:predicted SAM-dependent methyltransferase
MNETSKLAKKRGELGYYEKYFQGKGLEIGGWNDPLIVNGKPIQQHTLPDGSTHILPFADAQFDFLYASHVLEHFENAAEVLLEWLRVVKPNGYVYFAVPEFTLYEKNKWPSRFNKAHKQWFTLGKIQAIIANGLKDVTIEFCRLEDENYNYELDQTIDQTRGNASCQIDCCIRKGE